MYRRPIDTEFTYPVNEHGQLFLPCGEDFARPAPIQRRRSRTLSITVRPKPRWIEGTDPLSGYEPNVDPEIWAEIEPAVRAACEMALPVSDYEPFLVRSLLKRYVEWAWRCGLGLSLEELLEPLQMDYFLSQAPLAEATKGNYRSILRQLGRRLIGPPAFPTSVALSRSRLNDPFSVEEVVALNSWVVNRRDTAARFRLLTLMACSLGAGLRTAEICALTGRNVELFSDSVRLRVAGNRARSVWVRSEWESTIVDQALFAGGESMLGMDHIDPAQRTKSVSNLIDRQKRHRHLPKFSVRRFRATWIVGLLDHGCPPRIVADAAGINTDQVGQYIEFTAAYDEDEFRHHLRGEP